MQKLFAIPLVMVTIFLSACQSSPLRQFSELKAGMEKDDVLNIMGSPNRSQRFHGKDRWTYVFYDNKIRFEKEIHFFEGNAVYIGEVWQPEEARSAYFADRVNEEKNKKLDDQITVEKEKATHAFQDYEGELKGTTKVIYTPQFIPVR
jgi:outer membrane protein assembly factor BamE